MSHTDRDPFFDNLRAVLIWLVVLGHALELFSAKIALLRGVYFFVYSFHMPLFAFVAGAFSAGGFSASAGRRLVTRVVAPFVAFDVLYSVANHLLFGTPRAFDAPLSAFNHLWFLVSLACWRLALPAVPKRPWAVAVAVAVGLGVGFVDAVGLPFGLSRTLVLFPFFLLGAIVPRPAISRPPRAIWRWVAGAALLCAVVAAVAWGYRQSIEILLGRSSYAAFGAPRGTALLERLGAYAAAACLGGAVVALVPRRRLFFTAWGARTMTPFLLHKALPMAIAASLPGRVFHTALPAPVALAACAIASAALVAILSSRAIVAALRPLTAPKLGEVPFVLAAAAVVAALAVLAPAL